MQRKESDSIMKEKLNVLYFTDPICSACWIVEADLRKLVAEYGASIQFKTIMGGLLPDWEGFSSQGITKPADVATHWREMGFPTIIFLKGEQASVTTS
jgi:predicted DsbA family dithiol-disulfide isomerase